MKKILILFLASFPMLFTTACSSGISQSNYDSILTENEELKAENISLSEEITKLKSEKDELVKSTINFVSEITETQIEDINHESDNQYVQIITEQIFGQSCDFIITDNTLYINAFYTQEYSYELYEKMVDDCHSFAALCGHTRRDTSTELLAFDSISIFCWDKDSNRIMSILYSLTDTESLFQDIMLNIQYSYDIVQNSTK